MENQNTKPIAEYGEEKSALRDTGKAAIKQLSEIWQRRQERIANMEALEQELGITVEEKH